MTSHDLGFLTPDEPRACPDGAACHHDCAGPCWRVRYTGPLSTYAATWGPYPHLVAAVQAELQAMDPAHDWEVTSGYAGDPPEIPTLRIDRTGPELFHPVLTLALPKGFDYADDYSMAQWGAPVIAQYVVAAGNAMTAAGRLPLVNDVVDDPDGTRNLPHPWQPLGSNFSDGFCRRCGRDATDPRHHQDPGAGHA